MSYGKCGRNPPGPESRNATPLRCVHVCGQISVSCFLQYKPLAFTKASRLIWKPFLTLSTWCKRIHCQLTKGWYALQAKACQQYQQTNNTSNCAIICASAQQKGNWEQTVFDNSKRVWDSQLNDTKQRRILATKRRPGNESLLSSTLAIRIRTKCSQSTQNIYSWFRNARVRQFTRLFSNEAQIFQSCVNSLFQEKLLVENYLASTVATGKTSLAICYYLCQRWFHISDLTPTPSP